MKYVAKVAKSSFFQVYIRAGKDSIISQESLQSSDLMLNLTMRNRTKNPRKKEKRRKKMRRVNSIRICSKE
jgi:hypothetical protein